MVLRSESVAAAEAQERGAVLSRRVGADKEGTFHIETVRVAEIPFADPVRLVEQPRRKQGEETVGFRDDACADEAQRNPERGAVSGGRQSGRVAMMTVLNGASESARR